MAAESTLHAALALHRQGDLEGAARLCKDVLARMPHQVDALQLLGLIHIQLNRPADALSLFDQAAALAPGNAVLNFNRGLTLLQLGRGAEAAHAFAMATQANPGYGKAHLMQARALRLSGHIEDALASLDRALQSLADPSEALLDKGALLYELKRYEDARAAFAQLVGLQPGVAAGYVNLGCTLFKLSLFEDALNALDRAIALEPRSPDAHFNRGLALSGMSRHREAVASYSAAISMNPAMPEALLNRGVAYGFLKAHREALSDFEAALALKPGDLDALVNLGNTLADAGQVEAAIAAFARVLEQQPTRDFVLDAWLQAKMKICAWADFEQSLQRVEAAVAAGVHTSPTRLLAITGSAAIQHRCAEEYASLKYPPAPLAPWPIARYRHQKIRLGYFSADYFSHATAFLMAGLFEQHDRSRFEVEAFSFGNPPFDVTHQRLRGAFDKFHDVSDLSDADVVRLARAREIDIAVDLKGLSQDARPRLFAMGLAPLQVAYLGYPFTMGSRSIQYMVADQVVVPEQLRQHYTEKMLYLPDSYQVNDNSRSIAPTRVSREQLGLPAEGFVFCCFNNSYKITPEVFSVWMRLLKETAKSVLWLFEGSESAKQNLRRAAQERGIDPDRLVFAPRAAPADHLARHAAADLFLDTLPCNAHTTASDALWAGLPLVTCTGETFASRVAASLLHAVGLPELVVESLPAYEDLALGLARDPVRLGLLRERLARNRHTTPLFDTQRFARHLEAGFTLIHERLRAGLEPDHVVVAAA